MFLNDLPYLIRLGKSIFITKKFSLASGRDFLVGQARAHKSTYIFARPKIDQTLFLHQPVVLMAATPDPETPESASLTRRKFVFGGKKGRKKRKFLEIYS